MKSLSARVVVYGLVVMLGLLSLLPNLLPANLSASLPKWYTENTLALGLDLRGGSYLLLEVDTANVLNKQNEQLAEQLAGALRKAKIGHHAPQLQKDNILVSPRLGTHVQDVVRIARELTRDPGTAATYSIEAAKDHVLLVPTKAFREALAADAVERSVEVVRRRLDESGLVEPSITKQGADGILVQLPGVENPQQVRRLLGTTADMNFHWVANGASGSPTRLMVRKGSEGEPYQLEQRIALKGEHVSDARLAFHAETGEPLVNFVLDNRGARLFADMTRENIGRPLAIVLDGAVITAPVIRSVIAGGSGEISGSFTAQEAGDLALLLRAGALPAPMQIIEERTVGPDLGSDTIAMGVSTGIFGALLVVGFMIAIYGRWGLIACVGLGINVALVFGVLSLLGATLTLPGIAGIILTIGMAVDANILINERIREETRKGRSPQGALTEGFKKAYSTIIDSNLTTLIAVSLLFLVGSGPVRGFAVTIGIGLITSLFTAIAVTRLMMEWRVRKLGNKPLLISGIKALDSLSNNTIGFMRGRFFGLAISAVLSLGAVGLFFYPGLKYGVDFSGGTVVEIEAPSASTLSLRSALDKHPTMDAAIQEFGDVGRFLVRLPMGQHTQGAGDVASGEPVNVLKDAVLTAFPEAKFVRVEMVGPKVSGQFADATILAILTAGAGMLAYLWFRFESHFALAATATIALDLTKTIGFFVLAGVEFNLTAVAALLALIGYSINDKVVVFDRVRENLRLTPDKPLMELLNQSITSTLTRTVFTSVTTFLALLPMAVAGGSAVASFALPMLFGIVIGTSSSVFIAAPIVYVLGQRRLSRGLSQLRPTSEDLRKELDAMP